MENLAQNPDSAAVSSTSAPQHPKFVRWAIVLAIIVVLNIVFLVIRGIAFPSPQYETYCPASLVNQPSPQTADTCSAAGGTWQYIAMPLSAGAPGLVDTSPKTVAATAAPSGYCDLTSQCSQKWEDAQKSYEEKAFVLMVALGILAVIAGILPLGSSIVSSGLSYGGVLALVIGSGMYWNEAGNWLRLAIALVALAILIYIGVKRFRD